jgi:magnesium chelatase family protein
VAIEEIADDSRPENTAAVAERVAAARSRQLRRQSRTNARLEGEDLAEACAADPQALAVLARAMRQLGLSARAYHRVLRVARTIADLAQTPGVRVEHVAEAITLRQLDRRPADAMAGSPVSA